MGEVLWEKEESFARMQVAIEKFKTGSFVLIMDSKDRENECDMCIAAEKISTEQMAFTIRHSTRFPENVFCLCRFRVPKGIQVVKGLGIPKGLCVFGEVRV